MATANHLLQLERTATATWSDDGDESLIMTADWIRSMELTTYSYMYDITVSKLNCTESTGRIEAAKRPTREYRAANPLRIVFMFIRQGGDERLYGWLAVKRELSISKMHLINLETVIFTHLNLLLI